MTLLGEEGRWLKVRVQGRTGFVPRSKVDMPDNAEIARNTRRRPFVDGRGTHRGFDSQRGPDDCVGADATGDVAQRKATTTTTEEAVAKKAMTTTTTTTTKKPAKKPRREEAAPKRRNDDDDDDDTAKKPAQEAGRREEAGAEGRRRR